MRADDRDRTGPGTLARCCAACYTTSALAAQESNLEAPESGSGGSAISPTGHQSPRQASNLRPAAYKAAALPAELRGRGVLGAIRTRTGQHLGLVPLPLGYEDARAAARSRTAGLPLTRRALLPSELQRLGWDTRARTWLLSGFSARRVCQFPHIPSSTGGGNRTRTSLRSQGLSLSRLPVTPRPRAP